MMGHQQEEKNMVSIKLKVNGETYERKVDPRMLLVHFIRDELGLTGTHVGCDTSNCGTCTVIIDGKSVKSCTMFAVQADGRSIDTIEGMASDGEMHAVQKAFQEKHGLQCGFCTPGMIMQVSWLLKEKKKPTEQDIRWGISGNICRCTGYQNIVDAALRALEIMEE